MTRFLLGKPIMNPINLQFRMLSFVLFFFPCQVTSCFHISGPNDPIHFFPIYLPLLTYTHLICFFCGKLVLWLNNHLTQKPFIMYTLNKGWIKKWVGTSETQTSLSVSYYVLALSFIPSQRNYFIRKWYYEEFF